MRVFTPKGTYVDVSFGVNSGTWDIGIDNRVACFRELLKHRPVDVVPGYVYASVRLVSLEPEGIRKQQALAKLTDEEKELLGL